MTQRNLENMTNDELLDLRKKLNEKLKKGPENIDSAVQTNMSMDNVPKSKMIILSIDPNGPKIDDIKSRKGEGELIATSRGWQKVEGAENISYNLNITRWRS